MQCFLGELTLFDSLLLTSFKVGILQIEGLLESFKKSTHMIYGGGIGLACALLEGGSAKCVQKRAEGGGGQKRPKNCVRTIWTAPKAIL